MAVMQLMWISIAVGAVVIIRTEGSYLHARPNGYIARGPRLYNIRQLNAAYDSKIPSHEIVPLQPQHVGNAIDSEMTDDELQLQLQQLVDHGILTPNELKIFVESSRIVDEIQHLMTQDDNRINNLEQLLIQKITKWYKENGGSVSDVTQQIPSFFQDAYIQEELKELVQQGILNRRDIELFIESSSTISKLDEALERGDETVKQIYILLGERRALQQQNQKEEIYTGTREQRGVFSF